MTASDTPPAQQDPAQRVMIFDTTLRDGEQAPRIALNTREKVEIAQQLARLGVDVIEAGFPISSPGDFEATRAVALETEGLIVAALSRANERDVTVAGEAVRDAQHPRIHTFIATSDIHLTYKLKMDRAQVLAAAVDSVRLARSMVDDVEFSCEDATRSDPAFVAEVVGRGHRRGRDHHQHPRHRRLHHAHRVPGVPGGPLRPVPGAARRGPVGPLPQRPGARGRQLAGRRPGGGPPGGGLHQRHRRAGRQRQRRGARDDPAHARRRAGRALVRHRHPGDHAHQQDGQPHDRLRGAAEQGDRGAQRLRPRGRHPPARHAQQPADLRDHGLRVGGPGPERDRAGQALGPARPAQRAGGAGLRAGPRRAGPGVHPLQGGRRPEGPGLGGRPGGDRPRRDARRGRGRGARAGGAPLRGRHRRRAPGARGGARHGREPARGRGRRRRAGGRADEGHRRGGRQHRRAARVPGVGGHERPATRWARRAWSATSAGGASRGPSVSTDVLEASAIAYVRAVNASRHAEHGERVAAGGV